MRELDFSKKNLFNRWCGVNSFWRLLQGEVKQYVKISLERALGEEVQRRVGCSRYQRSQERCDYRNGYYTRELLTSYGWIEDLQVPRLRSGGYETEVFEKYRRRQRQLDWVLLEGFLLGHATRKTRRNFKLAFGATVSAQTISNLVKELDEQMRAFHRRQLSGPYHSLYLDGLQLKLRKPRKLKKVLLVALAEREDGSQELLSFQLLDKESEATWSGFVMDLKYRGLAAENLEVVVSDGNAGLTKALDNYYPRVPRQLCTFHKVNDLEDHLADRKHRWQIKRDAFAIFEAETGTEARKRLRHFSDKWQPREARAVKNFLRNIEYCFTYLEFPQAWQKRLKTNNPVERYLEEIRRRIIPMRSFNNATSAERIIYGIVAYVLNKDQEKLEMNFTQNS